MKSVKPKKLAAIDLLINSASLRPAISQNNAASRNAVANLSDGIPIEIPPDACRPWKLADRPLSEMEHKAELMESFKSDRVGQLQPIIVRPVNDPAAPGIAYEVISGRVRWMAAKELGVPVQAIVRDLTDREAYVVMSVENRQRKNISDWARAKSYQRALLTNIFDSAQELAGVEGISKSTLSFYLGFAELPNTVAEAFGNIAAVSYRMGYAIAKACKSQGMEAIIPLIPRIESGEISRQDIEAMQAQWVGAAHMPGETQTISAPRTLAPGNPLGTVRVSDSNAPIILEDADTVSGAVGTEVAGQGVKPADDRPEMPPTFNQHDIGGRAYSEPPKKIFVSTSGRKLFTYNQASRGWLIRINPEFSAEIDESAIINIGRFIEELLGQSKT